MTCSWHVPDDGVGPRRAEWARQAPQEQRRVGAEGGGGGGGVAVRYRVLTDPGTALPGFLVDLANQSSVPDVMRAFNARATSGVYEREDAAAAAAGSVSRDLDRGFSPGWSVNRRRRQGARGAAPVGGLREDHDVAVGAAAKDGDRVGREGWRSEERMATRVEGRMKEDGDGKRWRRKEVATEGPTPRRAPRTINERFELQEIYIS